MKQFFCKYKFTNMYFFFNFLKIFENVNNVNMLYFTLVRKHALNKPLIIIIKFINFETYNPKEDSALQPILVSTFCTMICLFFYFDKLSGNIHAEIFHVFNY